MAVQQSKVSKARTRARKSANRYEGLQPGTCAVCGNAVLPHRVCKNCGNYDGRQVITISAE
ncbi:MAG TPA: 50S ribosomal protein L32 [Longimicrobiales bacterium]|nr:50S ribosomal protein L32 [Longimicrobiales bacterium]